MIFYTPIVVTVAVVFQNICRKNKVLVVKLISR